MPQPLRIALAPGDGIGPEIMDAALAVFRAVGVMDHLEFVPVEMGQSVFARDSRGMTDQTIRTVESCGLLFKGPMGTPSGGGGKSINVTARKLWSAYANLRHFVTLPGVETVYSKAGIPVNFYIVRENIEDTYGGVEHRLTADVMQCKRLISAPGSDEVHRFVFDVAQRLGIRKVHCGHKANIMKMTDGLFLNRFRAAGAEHPGIEIADVIIDALCMNLVMRPHQYQMIVLPNLQGDIVSDLAAGLVGGLGFAPSANIGKHMSIFEAVHGTAPDIAGRGIANPTSLLLSGLMMLRHIGLLKQAAVIENALLFALESGIRTGDFGDKTRPALGTRDFAQAIIERLGASPRTVSPAAISDQSTISLTRPAPPAAPQLIRTFEGVTSQIAGFNAYLDISAEPEALAAELTRACQGTPFRLTSLTNRGTQVWPTGSVYTECVDCFAARFEAAAGAVSQADCIALIGKVAARYTVGSYELLRTFNGERGFSLAQGQ